MVGAARAAVSADAAGAQKGVGDLPWISGVRLMGFLRRNQRTGCAHSWHAYADRVPVTRRRLAHHPAHAGLAGGRGVELRAALLCVGSSYSCTVARRKRSGQTPQGQRTTPRAGAAPETRRAPAGSCGELPELVAEVVAVGGCAAALADGLGHVRVQLRDEARVAGQGDPDVLDGQLADVHDKAVG